MEYLIVLGILGLGYKLQSEQKSKTNKKFIEKVTKNQIPSPENVYTSKRAYNIFQEEQDKANVLLEKSKYPQDTNVVTPGPTFPIIYNKVDYSDKTLPVEFNNYQKYDNILIDDNKQDKPEEYNLIKNNERTPNSGGFSGISLTGDPINPNSFTHNNMVPFFGGAVRQNLDEFSTRGIFENFTGTQDNYQKKQEQSLLFQPQKNMSNVYGTGSLDGFMLDRYYVSNIRSNETPIEKVYVGPGLNQGYTNEPSGGFQQPDAQDYATPKTTDEIRVKTNPKISYYGRVVSGEKINKPGKIGTVYKNKPDTFYVQEPDRYFTTTGQVIAQEQRPCIITKYTNRKTTELKTRTGSAAPTNGTVAQVRSKYKISHKITYGNDGPRNADKTGSWSILDMLGLNTPNDYGKQSIRVRDNNRVLNNKDKKEPVINFKSPIEKGVARNNQKLKYTKKVNFVKNSRENGNYQGINKSKVYNPNDIPKATIKETNIHNNHSGMMGESMYKGVVYDPNDVTRTTIKETNIHNNHSGMMSKNAPSRGVVYDPENIARTTTKETTIKNKRKGNINNANKSIYIKNSDKAKKTTKETTIINNAKGIVTRTRGDGYLVKDIQVPDTIRSVNSVQYIGDASKPSIGAYDVTDVNAPNTMRQFTSDIEYFGGSGNGGDIKPMSYEDIYNAEIKAIRSTIDEGYTPGPMGVNEMISGDNINVTTTKIGDIQNKYLTERGVQVDKIYNSINQLTHLNITQQKEIVPNEPLADRINPEIVSAFQENPYTQSLTSWA